MTSNEQPRTDPGRYLCTPEQPMPNDAPGYWSHQDTVRTWENSDATHTYYKCRSCGSTWDSYGSDY